MYIWLCIVSQLINIHKNYEFGAPYEPSSSIDEEILRSIVISILRFVDDYNLSETRKKLEWSTKF